MTVGSADSHSMKSLQGNADVRLPPIRNLGSFDGTSAVPPPTLGRQDSFPHRPSMSASRKSPTMARASLPPLPRFSDPRSRAEQQHLPPLSHNGQGYPSSASNSGLNLDIPSSSRLHHVGGFPTGATAGTSTTSSSRQATNYESPPPSSSKRADFSHPFFDRGKEQGAASFGDRASASPPSLGLRRQQLEDVQQSLEFTQNIVSDGLNGHGITQALLDSATEAVGNAWTVLREAGASPAVVHAFLSEQTNSSSGNNDNNNHGHDLAATGSRSRTKDNHSREGASLRFERNGSLYGAVRPGQAPAHTPVPSGSIFGLNHKSPSPSVAANTVPDRPSNASRPAYQGQDVAVSPDESPPPGSTPRGSASLTSLRLPMPSSPLVSLAQPNDDVPRPPTSVVRTQASDSRHGTPSRASAENETSFMYAPSSIRKRLAAMHARSDPREAIPSPDRTAMASMERPMAIGGSPPGPSGASGASGPPGPPGPPGPTYQAWPKPANNLPPPPSTVSQPVLHGYPSEHDMMSLDRRVLPSDSATKYKKRSRAPAPSCCKGCGTNETPEWRRGPDGARTLCNACGLHFAKVSKKKPSAAETTVDPGYQSSRYHGMGPVDPTQKSLYD